MKRYYKVIFLLLLIFLGINCTPTYATSNDISTTRILFIGNSSTYYNQMPLMVEGLAKANNINCEVKSITASSYKLTQFATTGNAYNTEIVNALSKEKWDFVILQEHRENIMGNLEATKNAITNLKSTIDSTGAKTILYETQADYIGNDFIIDGTSIYFDNITLQNYMTKFYFSLGNKFDCKVAPVGVNYTRCMKEYPEINLYNSDMIHPTLEGSYLAACTLFQTIFETSAYNNTFLSGSEFDTSHIIDKLDNDTAKKLQNVADRMITLSTYNVTLKKGEKASVNAKITFTDTNPVMANYSNTITYSSTNESSVGVNSQKGTITAIRNGSSMIKASTDSGLMAFCTVNVVQPSTSLTIKEGSIYLHIKDTAKYTTEIYPTDTTDTITWTSSNPSVVSVDETGTVKAKKIGSAKITAKTDSGIKLTRYVRVKLKTPTSVKAVKTSGSTKSYKYSNVKVTWKKNSSAVKYYIYRRRLGKSKYTKIATTTTNKFINYNVKKGRTYYYKIVAVYSSSLCNSYKSPAAKIKLQ